MSCTDVAVNAVIEYCVRVLQSDLLTIGQKVRLKYGEDDAVEMLSTTDANVCLIRYNSYLPHFDMYYCILDKYRDTIASIAY